MKKNIEIAKSVGEYCTIGAGVATIVIGVIAAFVAMPVFVSFVVAAGIGLICGLIGGLHESHKLRKLAKKHKKQASLKEQEFQELKLELEEIKNELKHSHAEIDEGLEAKPLSEQQVLALLHQSPAPLFGRKTYCNDSVMAEEKPRVGRHLH